jgi:hypothetical protein
VDLGLALPVDVHPQTSGLEANGTWRENLRRNRRAFPPRAGANRRLIVELFPTAHRRGSRSPSRHLIVETHGDTGTLSQSEAFQPANCCA